MKKKVAILIFILILVILVFGIYSSYKDSVRVSNNQEPKLTLKIVSKDENKITYWGLGYKVIRYPSVSPNEPYENNRGVKFGSWFMSYKLPQDNTNVVVKRIVDKTTSLINFACAEVLESFYKDDLYEYYYNCKKSQYIIVEYEDGSEETVKDALKYGRVKISDLDTHNIDYIKYEKEK